MKSLIYTLCVVAVALAILGSRSPLLAHQRTLEDRVRTLELQVNSLNQRVDKLDGRGSGGSNDGIRRTYTGIGETWILKNLNTRSSIITLGNGTRWEVSPADSGIYTSWKLNEVILIGANNDRQFPYSLTNQTSKQRITAQYVGSQ